MGASMKPEPLYQGNDARVLRNIERLRAAAEARGEDPTRLVTEYLTDYENGEGFAGVGKATAARSPSTTKPGIATTLLQGLTFGTSDEILAGGSTLVDKLQGDRRPWSEVFDANEAEQEARLARVRRESPTAAFVSEIGGSVASGKAAASLGLAALRGLRGATAGAKAGSMWSNVGKAAGAASAPTTTMGRLALGTGTGAAAGGVTGFTSTEGDATARLGGAARGAGAGALLGVALPAAGGVARRVLDGLGLRRAGSATFDAAADAARAQEVPVTGPVSVTDRIKRIATSARRAATPATASGRADEKVLAALTEGGRSLDDVEQAVQSAAARGKPVALVDVGGRPLQKLARGARTYSGDVIDERLSTRAAAQSDRFIDDIDDVIGKQRGIPDEIEAMISEQSAKANQLYPKARAAGIEVKPENAQQVDVLRRVLTKPKFRAAFAKAQEIAEDADDPIGDIFTKADDGSLALNTIPDVRTLDFIKRGVDAVLESPDLSRYQKGQIRDQLREVLSVYDELVPEYKDARRVFAGDAEVRNAYDAALNGSDRLLPGEMTLPGFTNASADEVKFALGKMGPSEVEAYRKGVIAALKRQEQNIADGGDRAKRLFGTPSMRAKLKLIFPDDASFESFSARMGDEKSMRGSYDFLRGGSNSADKLIEAGDASDMMGVAGDAISGNTVGALKGSVGAFQRRVMQGQSKKISEAIADRATLGIRDEKPDVSEILAYLKQLRALEAAKSASRTKGAASAGARGGAVAGSYSGERR
jgi:hypothetical protein